MKEDNTPHSFRRLLESSGGKYDQYVLSEARYSGMIAFMEKYLAGKPFDNALDIGCGAGVISRGLSKRFKNVVGVDGNTDNVSLARSLTDNQGTHNISYEYGLAAKLPVEDASVDLVVLNGVFEWVGLNDQGENPQTRQLHVLDETLRVLKPGGSLYLAIENRWHPRTLLRDPHTHLPLVNMLPRKFANFVSKQKSGRPFQAYIYGYLKLNRMLSIAGFMNIKTFIPFPGYQHPASYIPISPRRRTLLAIDAIDKAEVCAVCESAGRTMDVEKAVTRMRRRARWGVLGLLAHDYAIFAEKP